MTNEEKALALQKRHNLTGITFDLMATLSDHAAAQRQMCADATFDALSDLNLNLADRTAVVDACINATGDSDE